MNGKTARTSSANSSAESRAVITTDALVIGAGPVGLFQVFQLGLLGLSAQVVDALPHVGGQCIELYADKPIYDIPAVVACTGRELVDRLMAQIAPFDAGFHLGQEVTSLRATDDGRFELGTSSGQTFLARSVFIAAGVGAFRPRRINAPGLDPALDQIQVFHHPADIEPFAGLRTVVVGGDEAALSRAAALAEHPLADPARPVTLLHRRDVFTAEPELLDRVARLRASGALQFIAGQITEAQIADGRLVSVSVLDAQSETRQLPLDRLLVCLGLTPRLGPVADWGLALDRKQLVVDTARFETSVPGIHAVGDINHYPGKKKLILCGFHEATLAAHATSARLNPATQGPLLYTTSSALLHNRLRR